MSKGIEITRSDINKSQVRHILESGYMAIDIETTGLDWRSENLATIQIESNGLKIIFKNNNESPHHLLRLFAENKVKKIFHHAMFDVKFIMKSYNVELTNISCTKIAAKFLYTDHRLHRLKNLLDYHLDVEILKDQSTSNWNAFHFTSSQIRYAVDDVIYLKKLYTVLKRLIEQEGLSDKLEKSYEAIPILCWQQLNGYDSVYEY